MVPGVDTLIFVSFSFSDYVIEACIICSFLVFHFASRVWFQNGSIGSSGGNCLRKPAR